MLKYHQIEDLIRKIAAIQAVFKEGESTAEVLEVAQIKRKIVMILGISLGKFVENTIYFGVPSQGLIDGDCDDESDDEIYELGEEMGSYLRCYKLLGKEQDVYREIHTNVCLPSINAFLKETLSLRQTSLEEISIEQTPIHFFFQNIKSTLIEGKLRHLLRQTSKEDHDHYVSGY